MTVDDLDINESLKPQFINKIVEQLEVQLVTYEPVVDFEDFELKKEESGDEDEEHSEDEDGDIRIVIKVYKIL